MRVTRVVPLAVAFMATGCSHGRALAGAAAANTSRSGDVVEDYVRAEVGLLLATDDKSLELALFARNQAEERVRRNGIDERAARPSPEAQRPWARQVALVAILARGSVTENEVQQIAANYEVSDAFLLRHFGMQALVMSDDETVARNSGVLSAALLRETNDSIRRVSLPIAARLRAEERVAVFEEYVRTGSPSLAKSVYAVAWSSGRDTACDVRSRVAELGRGSGLESLEQVEAAGGLSAFRLPSAGCSDERPSRE